MASRLVTQKGRERDTPARREAFLRDVGTGERGAEGCVSPGAGWGEASVDVGATRKKGMFSLALCGRKKWI